MLLCDIHILGKLHRDVPESLMVFHIGCIVTVIVKLNPAAGSIVCRLYVVVVKVHSSLKDPSHLGRFYEQASYCYVSTHVLKYYTLWYIHSQKEKHCVRWSSKDSKRISFTLSNDWSLPLQTGCRNTFREGPRMSIATECIVSLPGETCNSLRRLLAGQFRAQRRSFHTVFYTSFAMCVQRFFFLLLLYVPS